MVLEYHGGVHLEDGYIIRKNNFKSTLKESLLSRDCDVTQDEVKELIRQVVLNKVSKFRRVSYLDL